MNKHINSKLSNGKIKSKSTSNDQGAFVVIASILFAIIILFLGNIFFPESFRVITTFIWGGLFSVVVIFFGLGTLTLLGLRKEVTHTLEMLVEGSLSILDFVSFLKRVIEHFISKLQDFLLFIAPTISLAIALLIYLGMLVLYKFVGRENDVTFLTLVLTIISVVIAGILTRPREKRPSSTWFEEFTSKISSTFSDSFEVVIFLFFLTMDSTRLFFLPDNLNTELHASISGYNLMVRGLSIDSVFVTASLVIVAICFEITRNIMRISTIAMVEHKRLATDPDYYQTYGRVELIKIAVRKSFNESKDDLVKFIAFTTVLLYVFLMFPRLKLVAMATASLTAMVMDLALPARLTSKKGDDLISRLFDKAFKF